MTTRKYSSRSQQTTLAAGITDTATSATVISGSGLLGGATVPAGTTFTVVIDPDTALEEIVDVTAVSTNVLTIVRGVENAGTGQAHSAGAAVRHMAIGRDFREANLHIEATGGYNDGTGAHTMHGIASGEGDVVGTLKNQTLTNKTLTAPIITNPSISGAGVDASIVFEGATPDAFETTLTVVDPTQDNTITLPNTTGTVVIANAAQTLTNKTMGDALNAGGFKITNLATPTDASDAVRKDFADAQVAAAATSAASASTSASSALTSANSASASQSAATTSASSALTSQTAAASSATAAATSAASAATSASSALTSASSAATSATSAAASATAAAGYVVPSQTGNNGKVLATDGTAVSWSTLANATGLPISTGVSGLGANVATFLATPSSANLFNAMSNKTGAGFNVFSNSPTISAATSSDVPLIVKAVASQTADIQQWQASNGAVYMRLDANGNFIWSGSGSLLNTGSGAVVATAAGTTSIPMIAKGASGQTGNLQEWRNASNTVLARVNSSGQFVGDGSQLTGISSLPSQTGNAGRYLTTDGTSASWATVTTDPTADIFMMMGA